MNSSLWDIESVADYLKLGKLTIYIMVREGDLPAFKIGKQWRFKRERIEQWIQDRESSLEKTD